MKKNQKNSITVHEYAAINRHVDEVAARNLELTRLKRTQVHRANVKNAGYLMAAIAVAALIMAAAYWLYKAANAISPSHDHNEIVDGESYSNGDIVRDTEKIVIIEKPVVVPVEVEVEGEKIRNFTIFVEKSTVLDGIDEVVTGVTYISSDNKWPSYQWCYTTNPLNNVYATQIKLAEKKGRGGVDWQDISGDDAKQYGSTVENLRAAKQFCSFVFKPAQEGKQRITSVDQGKQTSSGSGFFIHKRGYLITNEHVIR
ncbi:MAG TPA: serine protease, partial [Chromatiaceae bacterium]|nr:serine protease [Chromatiaceae bacterium]